MNVLEMSENADRLPETSYGINYRHHIDNAGNSESVICRGYSENFD